jgi:ubiquinone/menaquinone biosynthesis C-methylase UbiE
VREDSEGIKAWDAAYKLEEASMLWGEPPVPYVIEKTRAISREGVVLELPCGDGRNTLPLCATAKMVLAADSSPTALSLASRRLASAEVQNALLLTADIYNLPFLENQIPSVLCWDLLGHLREPDVALAELVRVTSPGGTIVANVFALGDSTRGDEMVAVGNEEYMYQDRLYFRYYDRSAAERLVDGVAGVAVREITEARWTEPAHPGYREYEHEHVSWAFVLEVGS